jgi:RNA-splicing ligase RtcB
LHCTRIISLSDFAFMRFMSNNLLTQEESQHKDEIVNLTEQVLDAKGLECDERISKLSEEKLREILEEVRKLRNRRKRIVNQDSSNSKEEPLYVQ